MGRVACLESRRQGVRHRRLAGGRAELHLQGERHRLRDAQGPARPASGSISRLARDEMDSTFRQARTLRCRLAVLYPPVARHRCAGTVEEEAHRAWAGAWAEMKP